jgi:ubiquinone biosynthesis protein UbiJ
MTNGPQLPLARELAALLERALNREIAESTAATDLLAELDGESFAIDLRGLGVRCVLRAAGERVAVEPSLAPPPTSATFGAGAGHGAAASASGATASAATATLSASPFDLLRLARASDLATLRGTGAQITGSPEVAERFAKLLKLARPDLEEHAARWIGDVPAHALGEVARGAGAWLERAARALRANTAEFLQEESRALPAALEAQAFYADVEKLRDDVERAAARLARIERR